MGYNVKNLTRIIILPGFTPNESSVETGSEISQVKYSDHSRMVNGKIKNRDYFDLLWF